MIELIQAVISGLAVGAAYALVALSFNIQFTTSKTLNFGQGDFVSAGGFVSLAVLFALNGASITGSFSGISLPVWQQVAAALGAVATVGLLGAALYFIAVRTFVGKPGLGWVMSTLGFGILIQSIGLAVWGANQIMVPGPFGDEVVRVFGAGVRRQEILLIVVAALVMFALDWIVRRTMIGKAMRAVAHSRDLAYLMGINVSVVIVGAFVVSTALAGLGGYLLAPITSASIFLGLGIVLKGFSAAIIGGINNTRGCVAGGVVLGIIESLSNMWHAQIKEIVVFTMVIIVLSIKPNGLFGKKSVEKV